MDSTIVTFLANSGVAGIVIVLIVLGWLVPSPTHKRALKESNRKDHEIAKLREALALERQRSNDTTQAGAVTIQLVKGLVKLASEARDERGHDGPDGGLRPSEGPLELTAEDLGLGPS